jgi:PAS domain S-box-containing protein
VTPVYAVIALFAVAAVVLARRVLVLGRRTAQVAGMLAEREADLQAVRSVSARLRTSEGLYRQLVEAADDVIYRTDADGRYTYLNPAAVEVLGYAEGELLGRDFLDIVRPDYREQARRYYQDQREQRIPNTYCEFPMLSRSGEEVWVGQHVHLVTEDGRFAGLQALARNITERKLSQQAIEREREQLRQIVTHAPVAMAMLDREGRHIAHSARWLRYLRVADPSVVGRTLAEVWPGMPKKYERVLERALAGEVVTEPEDALEREDGTRVYLRWTVHPWREAQGSVAGIVLVAQSIDLLVRARQAALEASRLKSEFVANMSHEIRTPMNGIIGMTRLLLDTALTAEQREFAEVIDASGRALLDIIDDILDFSKIEAGRVDLEVADFDLRRAVREVLGSFAEAAQAKGLELLCLIRHDVPSALRGDPGRLRQVLTNLVSNAVKFTERGEVVLRVTLEGQTEGAAVVRFEVRDTGIGIDPEIRPRLFQSFVQADGSTSRRYGGTGLGLAISKRLVSLMGGEIDVESQPGHGSTFWFTVRLERQPPEAAPAPAARLAGRRVLVVDDNATNRQILKQQLSYWGLRVTAVESGAKALAALRQAAAAGVGHDLAILDMKMPAMDGLSLARAIKSDGGLEAVKLILLTSFGQRGHGAEASRIGISAYLTKPVDEADLYDCLVEILAQGRSPRPPSLVTRHSLREARPPVAAHVLVAEDNEVNQKVAVHILEKLGYRVEVAENGREAMEACQRAHYDAVLMDAQMPELDGYEATRRIREAEGSGRRVPIIAMTASAMKGDRERCLEAGMDDYISKPVTPEELARVLQRWVSPHAPAVEAAEAARAGPVAGDLLDGTIVESLMSVDEDGSLMDELVATYKRIAPVRIAALRKAAKGNAADLERTAHSFLGSCGNLGCRRMADLCARLEVLGRSGSTEGAAELVQALEAEYAAVKPQLEALPGRHPARQR